jgi:FkbM family methyltransferase
VTPIAEELEQLLSESVESASRRGRSTFDEIAAPFEGRLVLFGAGGLGRRTAAGLRKVGIEPLCFADNSSNLRAQFVEGIKVYTPHDAVRQFGLETTYVIAAWNGSSPERMWQKRQQLASLGCRRIATAGQLFWKFPEVFLPFYPIDLPHKLLLRSAEVLTAFRALADEPSRREYVAQVRFRLNLDFDSMADLQPAHYFAPDVYRLRDDEFLVDCGAFDGDTIQEFVRLTRGRFTRVMAFEPDPVNWNRLEESLAALPLKVRQRICAYRQCVSDQDGDIAFQATGTDLAASGRGSDRVQATTLDTALQSERPTIIKFDIEGAELQALRGGAKTFRRCRPILPVSTYHQQSHLWEVPLSILEIGPEYNLYLRPHGTEGWDLVCYAVPRERSIV